MASNQSTPGEFFNDSDAGGRRARLRPKTAAVETIYGNSPLLAPLRDTNGMIFPYQPTINYTQSVEYETVSMVHTNQNFHAYTRTPMPELTVEGDWTVQNQTEGIYALACIHFLRVVTKMYFGRGNNLGTPPPVLLFDAFGQYMFNQLPVLVSQFTVNMPKEPNYVPIDLRGLQTGTQLGQNVTNLVSSLRQTLNLSGSNILSNAASGYVWLPAAFNISVSLKIQNTPSRLRQFNLDEFRNGSLLRGGGWI